MRRSTSWMKLAFLCALALYLSWSSLMVTSFEQGPNNRNVSVDTRVNITDSQPEILFVAINGGASNITLNAGSTALVNCTAGILDYNGGSTVNMTAVFHSGAASANDADDNNTHYTNGSCGVLATDGYYRNFSCTFDAQYYADSGLWSCNVTAIDDYGFAANGTNTTNIDALLALNVTQIIDYGDMAVGDTSSSPEQANITNLGNVQINVSVQGYGSALGDGLAFQCQVGNISVEYEKFNNNGLTVDPSDYTDLSSALAHMNLSVARQTNDSQQEINSSYWILVVPPNPFGVCNGTVVFQAESGA